MNAVSGDVAHDWSQTIRSMSNKSGAAAIDDLGALLLEGVHPFLDGGEARARLARIARAQRHAGDVEQVVDLLVGELRQQAGQEGTPLFADRRVIQRTGERFRQVAD